MKKTGVEVNAETAKALKDLGKININIDALGIMKAVGKVTNASTRAAIESAKKVADVQIAAAMKEVKQQMLHHPPGSVAKHSS